jgi:chemotaxis-related protein WspB
MLFLVFQLGPDRYAIQAEQVVEILPLVNAKHIPRAPVGVAGVFNYHGAPVPLIDLAHLALGQPSRKWMSTRIVLINYCDQSGKTHLLGILAERATETMHRLEREFIDPGIATAQAPYLKGVLSDADGIIQRIEIQNLVAETVGGNLFREPVESV